MEPWRQSLLDEAKTWLRTPWAHNQRVKNGGVDCGQFLIGVYVGSGVVKDFDTGQYAQDWMLHQEGQHYLEWVEKYMDRVDVPKPGDIVLWHFGKCFSHGGVVFDWPLVMHSYQREGNVCYGDGEKGELARMHLPEGGSVEREHRFYSIEKRL